MRLVIAALVMLSPAMAHSCFHHRDYAEMRHARVEARRERTQALRDERRAQREARREARQTLRELRYRY